VIILDASVMIGYLEPSDDHHARAVQVLLNSETELWGISPITLAEVFVGPARTGQLAKAEAVIADLGVITVGMDEAQAPSLLAELRATTSLRMPDCCVLLAAMPEQAVVATFDARLRAAGESLGLVVVS